MAFVRKVKTASGATAVQIVEKRNGRRRIVEHIGSAHTEAELVVLVSVAQQRLHAPQDALVSSLDHPPSPARHRGRWWSTRPACCCGRCCRTPTENWFRCGR